jgi:multiple antibiotic resistance protein
MTLFFATFVSLLVIINPLEALPVYLGLVVNEDDAARRSIARRSCIYATLLMFGFLIFGNLFLRIFNVPLDMVKVTGGIILTRLGFSLFGSSVPAPRSAATADAPAGPDEDVAFAPLAMPIMFGPGAMATILGMTSLVKRSLTEIWPLAAVSGAIVATMAVTYVVLLSARFLQARMGPRGIDAATRIVGFFVAAIGIGMVFAGAVGAFRTYGLSFGH